MKKSKTISLVLITAALASCHKEKPQGAGGDWGDQKVYMRSDTTAGYTHTHHHGAGIGTALLWYYAFRPYGGYSGRNYNRAGYYSSGIKEHSNIGHNTAKGSLTRGGFGRNSSVSS